MNQIDAKYGISEYSSKEHLQIYVDEKPLDIILHELYPSKNLIGLVPTLLDWLEDSKERRLVWERIKSNGKEIVPLLMCPDDVDLWCDVIVVEIEKSDNVVNWLRLGLDTGSYEIMPDLIGTTVDWFDKIAPLKFEKKNYEKFVSVFKKEIDKDEIKRQIYFWIYRISANEEIPESTKSFNFGIIELETGYQIKIVGTKKYNMVDNKWIKMEDYIGSENTLNLIQESKQLNRSEIQLIVKGGVEEFIERYTYPLTFIHRAENLTTGFLDGNLVNIERRFT